MSYTIKHIPLQEYLEAKALSQGFLFTMSERSPAHAMTEHLGPPDDSEALTIGSALHSLVLEPLLFGNRFVVTPKLDMRRNVDKEKKAKLVEEHPDAEFISIDQQGKVVAMLQALNRHSDAKWLLSDKHASDTEFSMFWERDRIICKGRVDRYLYTENTCIDIKTTRNAKMFEKSIMDYGYHFQAPWYLEGLRACGFKAKRFVFIAVENEPPHGVITCELSETLLNVVQEQIDVQFEKYKECTESGRWPCYEEHRRVVECPAWLLAKWG